MLLSLLKIENLKTFLILGAIVAAVWFFKDYQYQKSENIRQTENNSQLRKYDSLRFASQTYTKEELNDYLENNRKDLQKFLKQNDVKLRKIQSIITQKLNYKDTTNRNVNLQPILDAIKQNKNVNVPVVDSTDCLIVKGYVAFNNDTLSLNITDRQFKNKSDVVSYWKRKQWSFLGIKTRLFGKKQATVIIKDDCGKTQTFVINKNQ